MIINYFINEIQSYEKRYKPVILTKCLKQSDIECKGPQTHSNNIFWECDVVGVLVDYACVILMNSILRSCKKRTDVAGTK